MRYLRLCVALLVGALIAMTAHADTSQFGPFSFDEDKPTIIRLTGEIDAGAALNFRRALAAAPDAELLVLNSEGGLVAMGLLIADDVHTRKLATIIPTGSECYSACSLIFLAGVERQVDGKLGVHQISSDSGDLVSAQYSISDILDVLNRFETPIEVLTIMFRTPPDDMYVFSGDEIARFGINRRAGRSSPSTATTDHAPLGASDLPAPPVDQEVAAAPADPSSPTLSGSAASQLSVIEGYARRSDRMALYSGVDFFGNDIASERVADTKSCALECLERGDQCRAFTYNTDDRVVRGPNCFLKSRRGTADGNLVAISGELLRASDAEPKPLFIGVIDPTGGIFDNVDIPGGDLSGRPLGSATTAQQCRLACVENNQCVAFTFVKRKSECWLKGSVGSPRYMDGMISGAKSPQSFEAATISLE